MTQPIIVAFDGSEHGRDALVLARRFAGLLQAPLLVVYAYMPEDIFWASGTAPASNEQERRAVADMVEEQLAGFEGYELRMVASTSAAGAIQLAAEESGAKLIVVGASHHGAIGRIVLGTVTQAVLDAAPCAVAIAPSGLAAENAVSFKRIGVGFDDMPEAHGALAIARELAQRSGARLKIVWAAHLVRRTLPLAFAGYMLPDYFAEVRKEIEQRLEHAAAPREGLQISTEIASGETVAALVSRSAHLDLLVLGSRGYGPLRRVLLGSVSHAVVNDARCPVLVVGRGVSSLDRGAKDVAAGEREAMAASPR